MKKLIKIITLAVVVTLVAVSCSPEVEVTDYDWSEVNAQFDPARQGNQIANQWPTAGTPALEYSSTALNTIVNIKIDITIPTRADIHKKTVTTAALTDIISFYSYTKATTPLTVDTLSDPIPYTLEKTLGNIFSIKLTTSINTALAYSNILMRVDGKKYTYAHGLRLDVDNNGRIEDVYDDWSFTPINITGNGGGPKISAAYIGTGHKGHSFTLPAAPVTGISSENTGYTPTPNPPYANEFFFTGTGTSTNTNDWYIQHESIYGSSATTPTTAAEIALIDDLGETYAKGIKLQKLTGDTWTDIASAEYDPTIRSNINYTVITGGGSGYTHFVFKDITFEHLTAYRTIWTGSAYTETSGEYYGVKQRLYVYTGSAPSGVSLYTRTQVATAHATPVNSKLLVFAPYNFSSLNTTLESCDSEEKNVVIKVKLGIYNLEGQFYWNLVTLEEFKKSFQVVYAGSSNNFTNLSNTSTNLFYVDVKNVEFNDEEALITLDPNFSIKTFKRLYFRINNGISVTNKQTGTDLRVYSFGNSDPVYNHFAFYGPVTL